MSEDEIDVQQLKLEQARRIRIKDTQFDGERLRLILSPTDDVIEENVRIVPHEAYTEPYDVAEETVFVDDTVPYRYLSVVAARQALTKKVGEMVGGGDSGKVEAIVTEIERNNFIDSGKSEEDWKRYQKSMEAVQKGDGIGLRNKLRKLVGEERNIVPKEVGIV